MHCPQCYSHHDSCFHKNIFFPIPRDAAAADDDNKILSILVVAIDEEDSIFLVSCGIGRALSMPDLSSARQALPRALAIRAHVSLSLIFIR